MARVLIVDDEKSIRLTLRRFLQGDGHAVEVAEDVEQALAILAEQTMDVVVSDIILPRVTGVELLKRVHERVPDVQVIMMTGEPTVETASEAVRSGAFDYLAKPVERDAVCRVVGQAARVKSLLDEQKRLAADNRRYQEELEERVEERTRELREKSHELHQAQKLEAIGQLAGGVAHDFNNLLMAIGGGAQLAKELIPPDSPAHEDLDTVLEAAKHSTALTRQLLAFSRRQVLCRESLDLTDTLEGALRMLGRLLGEDIELRHEPGRDLHAVRADPGQVEQIVINLSVNARDAMPDGGVVSIATTNACLCTAKVPRPASQPEIPPGDYVMISVGDTGFGMTADVMARAFEPFFTTKEEGLGTGLGLSTVYGIVRQHDGYIDAESAPGAGTTFRVYLPVDESAGASPPTAQLECPRGDETVLVVEDDPVVRRLECRVLASLGYRVLESTSPEQALATVEAEAGDIDLILSDVVMPRMSGRELAERVSAARPETKILLTSGYTDNRLVAKCITGSAYPFIPKPFTKPQIASFIRSVLDA